MTSDHYAILGVTPTADGVVISAAYRALIRHYHPDTNPDPDAQVRAREITAAYAVLRDPRKRADYDARRSVEEELWSEEERGEPVDPPRAPAMRRVGIASAVLTLGLVAAVWAWPRTDQTDRRASRPLSVQEHSEPAPARTEPVVELQPESERLARLREETEVLPQPLATPAPQVTIPADPVVTPPAAIRTGVAGPARSRPSALSHVANPPKPAPAPQIPKAEAAATTPNSERLATLERMSSGTYVQSMANAGAAKKDLLDSARDRFAAQRKRCRSDTCIAETYVRQIRETGAIMEARTGPSK